VDELVLELDDEDEDEDVFFAFFFGSLLSAGRPSGAPALAVTAAAATSTLFGDASFAAGADGFFASLPDALLTPKATTNAARAAATAIPICRGCMVSP
jgi:hypothetical protein